MKQSIYDENDQYTDASRALDKAAMAALQPIFDEYVKAGYSVRDIAHVIMGAITDLELSTVLGWREVK